MNTVITFKILFKHEINKKESCPLRIKTFQNWKKNRMSIIKNISHSKFCWEGRAAIKYFWGECKIIKTTLERVYYFKRS